MLHPFLDGVPTPGQIAHRGGAGLAPENTLEAFHKAVHDFHSNALEIDVRESCDRHLVVVHDSTIRRCTDRSGAVEGLTLEELREADAGYRFSRDGGCTFPFRGVGVRIPTLEEVLHVFPGLHLHIELKHGFPGVEARFADLIRRCGSQTRVCVGSENDARAEALVRLLPDACHFFPRGALTRLLEAILQDAAELPVAPYLVLDMPLAHDGVRLVSRKLTDRAHAHGRRVNVWTVDEPAEMARLLEEGVDGIMTDRPDVLDEVVRAWRSGSSTHGGSETQVCLTGLPR